MIYNLQALRALAAWMVVAHHLREPLAEVWAPLGETLIFASGVDIFFVLSGYVMVVSTRGSTTSPTAFWRQRLVRIAPLYWIITMAIFGALLLGLSPVGVATWEWRDIAASFLFMGMERSDGYPGPLLGVGWTLAYEAFFYAVFGIALLAGKNATALVMGLIFVCVVIGLVAAPTSYSAQFYTAPILLEFAFGVGLAHLTLKHSGGAMIVAGIVGLIVGASALAMLPSTDLITPGSTGAIWRTACFGLPSTLIVAGMIALDRAGAVCHNQFVLDQGDASYALYLIHLPLIQVLEKAVGSGAVVLIAAPPVLAVTAHLIHRFWEQPVLTILRPKRFDLRTYRLAG